MFQYRGCCIKCPVECPDECDIATLATVEVLINMTQCSCTDCAYDPSILSFEMTGTFDIVGTYAASFSSDCGWLSTGQYAVTSGRHHSWEGTDCTNQGSAPVSDDPDMYIVVCIVKAGATKTLTCAIGTESTESVVWNWFCGKRTVTGDCADLNPSTLSNDNTCCGSIDSKCNSCGKEWPVLGALTGGSVKVSW